MVSARKTGLLRSTGNYIGFIDGDDFIGDNYFDRIVDLIEENQVDIFCTGFTYFIDDQQEKARNSIDSKLYEGDSLKNIYKQIIYSGPYFHYGIFPNIWCKIFKRELLEHYLCRVPDEVTLGEDACCVFPALLNCKSLIIDNNINAYYYRQIGTSMTKAYDPQLIYKIERLICYFLEFKSENNIGPDYGIDIYLRHIIIDCFSNEGRNRYKLKPSIESLKYLRNVVFATNLIGDYSEVDCIHKVEFDLIKRGCFHILLLYLRSINEFKNILSIKRKLL